MVPKKKGAANSVYSDGILGVHSHVSASYTNHSVHAVGWCGRCKCGCWKEGGSERWIDGVIITTGSK